jgi:HPt (histidine-containing phosphotransfer) domain-containing protein
VPEQQPAPIDLEGFRSAMRESGIEEIVVPMLQLFLQEAPRGMAGLSSAMATGDLDAASRAAHSLKSSAGNVRARRLAELLQQLEDAAGAKDGAKAARIFESVKAAHEAALRQLTESGIRV